MLDHSADTPRNLSVDEQRSLRMRLQRERMPEEEVLGILAELNPSGAPIVALTVEEKSNYECVSWNGIDNYRIHIPIRSGLQNGQLFFDRITGLYYIKKLPAVDVIE